MPDVKTIWLFREQLTKSGAMERLFERFDAVLRAAGYLAKALGDPRRGPSLSPITPPLGRWGRHTAYPRTGINRLLQGRRADELACLRETRNGRFGRPAN
jgi:hypothetical protein